MSMCNLYRHGIAEHNNSHKGRDRKYRTSHRKFDTDNIKYEINGTMSTLPINQAYNVLREI